MRSASSLPKVEHSLDEFIARANQTLVDVSQWGMADQKAKEDEEKRREQDALRWKAAEHQMRESDAREQSLRRQLDGLQGKLAEAEARAAVAMSASSSGGMSAAAVAAHDRSIDDLKMQIEAAHLKMKQSEQKSSDLSKQLELAKTQQAAHTAVDAPAFDGEEKTPTDREVDARIRLAEAKAAKALAAARAAAAGLTVSAADLSAIESGLVVPMQPERRTPWIAIMLAFAGGLGIMFLVWKFALSGGTAPTTKTETPTPAPAPQQVAPQPQAAPPPAPAAPAKPTVTPIDENPTPAPAAADDTKKPTATPIDEPKPEVKAEEPAPVAKKQPTPAPKPVAKPVAKPAPAPVAVKKPAPAPAPAVKKVDPPKKPAPAAKPQIEDPFATPAPKKAPAAPKKPEKPAGGIVDPFGG